MAVHFSVPPILWASDLHLDHLSAAGRTSLGKRLASAPGDVLLVTGDTSTAAHLGPDLEFLADAAARPCYFVLGNHDHYGSSVERIRDAVIDLGARRPDIRWLAPAGVITLDRDTALVGVDGWADGRFGDPLTTPLVLNDDRLIAEIAAQPTRPAKLAVKRALADADAARLDTLLERALPGARTIVVATHVPPFLEAVPATGRLALPHWRPLLVSAATGSVLKRFAAEQPDTEFLVLCGHTHAAADVMVLPNLRCRVMAARYGEAGLDVVSTRVR